MQYKILFTFEIPAFVFYKRIHTYTERTIISNFSSSWPMEDWLVAYAPNSIFTSCVSFNCLLSWINFFSSSSDSPIGYVHYTWFKYLILLFQTLWYTLYVAIALQKHLSARVLLQLTFWWQALDVPSSPSSHYQSCLLCGNQ